jgi:tripartite-type tricarboxylate transporter receptor subunit TctC
MTFMRLSLSVVVLVAAVLPAAADDTYPSRPITIVVPFPPGGIADLTARPLAASMERLVKQPVVITNKAGAGGAVGTQSAAIARPDGYTLLLGLVSISLLPERDALFGQKPAFTREQFVPIARLNADPPVVAVNAETPWKTVKDVLEDARRRPGEITYASSGVYGASHVPMEMLLQAAGGLKMRHLPTTGGGPATTAVLGKHALLWASPPALTLPHVKAGKMRVLATWGATRLAAFPEAPTLKELGYDVEYYLWAGLFAPRGTPPATLEALRDAVRQSMQDPEFKAAMDKAQTPIAYQDAEEFKAWWDRDAKRLAEVVKRIGKVEDK